MRRLCKTGIGLITGFIGSHTVTHNYSVSTLTASQFTIVLAESSYCVFTGCPSSNTVGPVHLQLFSEDCCFTVDSRLGNSTPNSQLTALPQLTYIAWPRLLLSHVVFTARASAILFTSFSYTSCGVYRAVPLRLQTNAILPTACTSQYLSLCRLIYVFI
jgi:hypothetical protein